MIDEVGGLPVIYLNLVRNHHSDSFCYHREPDAIGIYTLGVLLYHKFG